MHWKVTCILPGCGDPVIEVIAGPLCWEPVCQSTSENQIYFQVPGFPTILPAMSEIGPSLLSSDGKEKIIENTESKLRNYKSFFQSGLTLPHKISSIPTIFLGFILLEALYVENIINMNDHWSWSLSCGNNKYALWANLKTQHLFWMLNYRSTF